jgi:hypothetical protein
MEGAPVVPHDQIACPPAVLMDKTGLGRECNQLVKKRTTLFDRPSDDVGCM